MLKIGDKARINSVYTSKMRRRDFQDHAGTLVRVMASANSYDYSVEVMEGEYIGSLWLFDKEELDAA